MSITELSKKYKKAYNTIYNIVYRKSYKHIKWYLYRLSRVRLGVGSLLIRDSKWSAQWEVWQTLRVRYSQG